MGVVQQAVDRGSGECLRHDRFEGRRVRVRSDGHRTALVGGIDDPVARPAASWPAGSIPIWSNCSEIDPDNSTISACSPRRRRHGRCLRAHRRAASPGARGDDLEPGADRVAGAHGRRPPRPVGNRPAAVVGLRVILDPESYRRRQKPTPGEPTEPTLRRRQRADRQPRARHHHHAEAREARTPSHAVGREVVPSSWRATRSCLRLCSCAGLRSLDGTTFAKPGS